jgi:hypothetical protein
VLTSSLREYDAQQRLTSLAVADAQRVATRGAVTVARSVQTYQAAAVTLSLGALSGILGEQGIDTAAEATTVPASLLTGTQPVSGMLAKADTAASMVRLVETLVRDAGRTARAVDATTRPAVTGYVRSLQPPSCGRCAVLAGRVYRFSQGFQRHPRCDCMMTPTNDTVGKSLVTDSQEAFDNGWIRGLSRGDTEALQAGADLGQVVNVRRKAAGLVTGSSVTARAGRLTPQGCLSLASDRTEQLALLRRYGYIL